MSETKSVTEATYGILLFLVIDKFSKSFVELVIKPFVKSKYTDDETIKKITMVLEFIIILCVWTQLHIKR